MADDTEPPMTSKSMVDNDPRDPEEIRQNTVGSFPIELEEKIDILDKPLAIECAYPGWQPRQWPEPEAYPNRLPDNYERGGIRYPGVPEGEIDEQADELVAALEEGCAGIHVHPRNPDHGMAQNSPWLIADVFDKVYERADAVPLMHSWMRQSDGTVDFVDHAQDLIEAGDGTNKYIQGGVVLWPPTDSYPDDYEESVREGIEWYHDHGIKPIHKVRGGYHIRELHRKVIQGDMPVKEPMAIIVEMGHPYGWPMDQEPWAEIDLITGLQTVHQRFSDIDIVTGVYTGSRNWLPTTMRAILAGADMVRIGIEDFYWMYPHRDEVIQKNIDIIRKITDFCELIDRPTADAAEAREMLNISRT